MDNLDILKMMYSYQEFYNRKKKIEDLYKKDKLEIEKIKGELDTYIKNREDLKVKIDEVKKKIEEHNEKKADIEKKIEILNENKEKIKISHQLKSWEKDMEKQNQELGMLKSQISYDLEKLKDLETKYNEISNKINDLTNKQNEIQKSVDQVIAANKEQYENLIDEMKKIRNQLDIQFVEQLDAILERTNGVAMVTVDVDSCNGCYTLLPTYIQGELGPELKREEIEILQCPNCFRYLYYPEWFKI